MSTAVSHASWQPARLPQGAFEERVRNAKLRASGRWPALLAGLGVPETVLSGKDQPCPLCRSTRRAFRFDDRYGQGDYYCHGCGPGNGFKLLQGLHGWRFLQSLEALERALGQVPPVALAAPRPLHQQRLQRDWLNRTWQQCQPLVPGCAAARYLAARGLQLTSYPRALRWHAQLGYFEKEAGRTRCTGSYPALVAKVRDVDGRPVTLHRTYLDAERAQKAPVDAPRKLMSSGIAGAAIQLYEAGEELAVAEGIETALAVHQLHGLPVWSAIDAGNLARLRLPPQVRKVHVYADHDRCYAGQAAAYALAQRLAGPERRAVEVHLPAQPGDWLDELQRQAPHAA